MTGSRRRRPGPLHHQSPSAKAAYRGPSGEEPTARAERGLGEGIKMEMPFRPPIHRPQGWRPPEQVRHEYEQQRGSASSRGYDRDWQVLRLLHLQGSPLCVLCAKQGRAAAATVVDHVRPFKGRDDPRRMDPTNLESLCHPCHARKTNVDGSIPRFKSR
jgi:5-methylcytosine-specific restriction enzyme A